MDTYKTKYYLGLVFLVLYFSLSLFSFSGNGAGTVESPYVITNATQLQEMKDELTAFYRLGNNIDASATSTWNSNGSGGYYGFEPVGTQSVYFKGGFDGDNHTITDLYINRPSTNDVGLFGYSGWESDYIRNVGLINVDFTGGYRTGGLIARADTPIDNCYVTGSVSGSASNSVVGGFVAQSQDPITNCYARVDVTTQYEGSGFVSFNNDKTQYCYSVGSVQQITRDGGFVGNAIGHVSGKGSVQDCFWDTQTSGQEDKKEDHIIISNICYNPDGSSSSEYLYIELYNPTSSAVDLDSWDFFDDSGYRNIGSSTDIPANGFFLIGTSGMSPTPDKTIVIYQSSVIKIRDGDDIEIDAVSYEQNESYPVYRRFSIYGGDFVHTNDYEPKNTSTINEIDVVGKTTAEMKTETTFTDAGWDFTNIWEIDGANYPSLKNNPDIPLPVNLIVFSAKQKNNQVILEWQTGSEQENLGFVIERKDSESEYVEIASYSTDNELKGAGNTSVRSNYEFTDENVKVGTNYIYRISDVDYSGKMTNLKAVTISMTENNLTITDKYTLGSTYPNPFNPTFTLPLQLNESALVNIELVNILGQKVMEIENKQMSIGNNDLQINCENLNSGVYFVKVTVDNVNEIQKVVLLK